MNYRILDERPLTLTNLKIEVKQLLEAVLSTNEVFKNLFIETIKMSLNIFDVIDFRAFSGLVGETFAGQLARLNTSLAKNPNIDGYPDLLQDSTSQMKDFLVRCDSHDFIKYKYGGLEVKNTFGVKKSGAFLLNGDQRIHHINKKLDWKAHHGKTNNLIALFSDYVEGYPVIAGLFYSDQLDASDWSDVQRPKGDSAMTSFSVLNSSGFAKLKEGVRLCLNKPEYLDFITH